MVLFNDSFNMKFTAEESLVFVHVFSKKNVCCFISWNRREQTNVAFIALYLSVPESSKFILSCLAGYEQHSLCLRTHLKGIRKRVVF